jgi:hypothetical protein
VWGGIVSRGGFVTRLQRRLKIDAQVENLSHIARYPRKQSASHNASENSGSAGLRDYTRNAVRI